MVRSMQTVIIFPFYGVSIYSATKEVLVLLLFIAGFTVPFIRFWSRFILFDLHNINKHGAMVRNGKSVLFKFSYLPVVQKYIWKCMYWIGTRQIRRFTTYIVTKVDRDILLMCFNGNRNLKNGQFGVISRKNKNFGRSIVKCDEIHQISF